MPIADPCVMIRVANQLSIDSPIGTMPVPEPKICVSLPGHCGSILKKRGALSIILRCQTAQPIRFRMPDQHKSFSD